MKRESHTIDRSHQVDSAQRHLLCLLKIAYALRPLMFRASLNTLRADDFRPGRAVPVAPKLSPLARRSAA